MTYLYVGGMPSQTIAVWSVEAHTLDSRKIQEVGELYSPSFLCMHPTLPLLYAAERSWSAEDGQSGAVSVFEIDAATGELRRLFRCRSGGAFTAHVGVSPDGRFLTTANPKGPTLALFRLDARGIPTERPFVQAHVGKGATQRQAQPWPHSAYFDRSMRRVFACDLGLDRVFIYDLDERAGSLRPAEQPFVQVSSGAGARHLALAGEDRCVYVVNELDSTLSVFRYDDERRYLAIAQTLSTVPERTRPANHPAEILLSPDGRHVYVTNRGHDSIGVFRAVRATGRLRRIRCFAAQGHTPRHICLDGSGTLAAVCNQGSHEVALFRMEADGTMSPAAQRIGVQNPTCARLVTLERDR
ncbi:MAG TPA: lactonase family protein [Steroidobacteraceae bacterium]|nr:lactonase family protein [Steroidobacteraceae bacterium]